MTASEHAATPMLAAAHRVHGVVRDTALCDKCFASLWLSKACVLTGGLYGCQTWSNWSRFLREGDVFRSNLQTLPLNSRKGSLGAKQSAPSWAMLRECEHEPLQSYWFRAASEFHSGLLSSNSDTLKQALHTDLKLLPRAKTRRALNILCAFEVKDEKSVEGHC